MPEPSWQEVLLSQGLLLFGATVRFALTWIAIKTERLDGTRRPPKLEEGD